MESTLIAEFDTRRAAELAVEHVVQVCGVPRTDVFVQAKGTANTSGERPAGPDAKAAPQPEPGQKLEGPIEVSVDLHGSDSQRVVDAFKDVGAKAVRTK